MKLTIIASTALAWCSLSAAHKEQIPLQGSQQKPLNVAIIGQSQHLQLPNNPS